LMYREETPLGPIAAVDHFQKLHRHFVPEKPTTP